MTEDRFGVHRELQRDGRGYNGDMQTQCRPTQENRSQAEYAVELAHMQYIPSLIVGVLPVLPGPSDLQVVHELQVAHVPLSMHVALELVGERHQAGCRRVPRLQR